MAYTTEVRQEALRLRTEEHLGLQEIAALVGISKGTASVWLRGHPLPQEELKRRVNTQGLHGSEQKKNRGEESSVHRIVRAKNLGSVQIGKIAETAVLFRLLIHGFNPFGSVFDGDKTDWLVEVPATRKVWKVQVKTAIQNSHGLPNVDLRCGHLHNGGTRRYKEGDFDFIVGYDLFTDTCYIWSWEEVGHLKATVSVSEDAAEQWDKFLGV